MLSITPKEREAIVVGDGFLFWTYDKSRGQVRLHFSFDRKTVIFRTDIKVDERNAPRSLFELEKNGSFLSNHGNEGGHRA